MHDAPANFQNNYFWYEVNATPSTNEDVGMVTSGALGVADARGNIVNNDTSCYAFAGQVGLNAGYELSLTSLCIDAGATGVRQGDASPIVLDVDSNARTLGAAPDIGCAEEQ